MWLMVYWSVFDKFDRTLIKNGGGGDVVGISYSGSESKNVVHKTQSLMRRIENNHHTSMSCLFHLLMIILKLGKLKFEQIFIHKFDIQKFEHSFPSNLH